MNWNVAKFTNVVALSGLLLCGYADARHTTPQSHATIERKSTKRPRVYSSDACGLSFELPRNWRVHEKYSDAGSDGICTITLQPLNLKQLLSQLDVDVYTVQIEVLEASYGDALKESGFEQKEDGSWVALGRQNIESPAEKISGFNWEGMKSTTTAGCFHMKGEGGYAGLCDQFSAVLASGKGVLITIDASTQAESVFITLLKSLRFKPIQRRLKPKEV